eukprot:gene9770-biopygen19753
MVARCFCTPSDLQFCSYWKNWQRMQSGRVPDASRPTDFEETYASRTRHQSFLPSDKWDAGERVQSASAAVPPCGDSGHRGSKPPHEA